MAITLLVCLYQLSTSGNRLSSSSLAEAQWEWVEKLLWTYIFKMCHWFSIRSRSVRLREHFTYALTCPDHYLLQVCSERSTELVTNCKLDFSWLTVYNGFRLDILSQKHGLWSVQLIVLMSAGATWLVQSLGDSFIT